MLLEALLVVASIPLLACCGYLFGLTLLSARPEAPRDALPTTRFVAVIPAHDERLGIARTVQSLLAADYPEHLRRVLVVADNCTDDTADWHGPPGPRFWSATTPKSVGRATHLRRASSMSSSKATPTPSSWSTPTPA